MWNVDLVTVGGTLDFGLVGGEGGVLSVAIKKELKSGVFAGTDTCSIK